MIEGQPSVKLPDQHEGRAGGILFDAQPPGDALSQAGLARPQLAHQQDDVAGLGYFAEAGAELLGLLGAGGG